MSHPAQIKFLKKVKRLYPQYFKNVRVADVGSLNINGCARDMFTGWSLYRGIDIVDGDNVDIVGEAHLVLRSFKKHFTTVLSSECLEHDRTWRETLCAMYDALEDGGLMIVTAAGDGREEHGTAAFHPTLSPATNDYYENISNAMFSNVLPPKLFTTYFLNQDSTHKDIQFYGIKIGEPKPYPKTLPIRINNARRYYSETIVELKKHSSFSPFFSRLEVMRGSIRELFT